MPEQIDTNDFGIGSELTGIDGNQFQGNLEIGPTTQQKFAFGVGGMTKRLQTTTKNA